MADSAIAIATAAFADGETVTQVVDWNDPSQNLDRVLKISRGVLYKIEPTIQPVTNYMDTIIQGWFYDDETYEIAMVKIKYDSHISTLMLLSKQIYDYESGDLGSNTITTPRALSMDDIGNNPMDCYGSFGETEFTRCSTTHYEGASSVPVKAGELDAGPHSHMRREVRDPSTFATVTESDYDDIIQLRMDRRQSCNTKRIL